MVFSFEKDYCTFKLRALSEGALMCNDETCILCTDGIWDWPMSFHGVEIHAGPGKDFPKL